MKKVEEMSEFLGKFATNPNEGIKMKISEDLKKGNKFLISYILFIK